MKSPYIKKIDQRGSIEIWLVDGEFIRKNIDIEFTNFGHHFVNNFVPLDEFWIDREKNEGEAKYYIEHMLIEHRLMAEGRDKYWAMKKADQKEREERMRSNLAEKFFPIKKDRELMIEKVHRELFKEFGKIKVWEVNGELVRDYFYIDFTEGGHDKVFPFIPAGEIWLDDDLSEKERKFVLLHELHERNLMPEGHDISIKNASLKPDHNYEKVYGPAHLSASRLEYYCRQHPDKLEEMLKQEINKIR